MDSRRRPERGRYIVFLGPRPRVGEIGDYLRLDREGPDQQGGHDPLRGNPDGATGIGQPTLRSWAPTGSHSTWTRCPSPPAIQQRGPIPRSGVASPDENPTRVHRPDVGRRPPVGHRPDDGRTGRRRPTPVTTPYTVDLKTLYGGPGLAPGGTYSYRMRALDPFGSRPSGCTGPFSLTTAYVPPDRRRAGQHDPLRQATPAPYPYLRQIGSGQGAGQIPG